MHRGPVAFTGRGQRFEELQGVVTRGSRGEIQRGRNRADETRTDERQRRWHWQRAATLKRRNFAASVSNDGEAMAARQSSQFKRSGVGGRLIITLAVNI